MKSFFSVTLFIAAAIAQSATIGLPTENQEINPGTEVVVQVQRPVSSRVTSSQKSGLLIDHPELSKWVHGGGHSDRPLLVCIRTLQERRGYSWNNSIQRAFQPCVPRDQPAPV